MKLRIIFTDSFAGLQALLITLSKVKDEVEVKVKDEAEFKATYSCKLKKLGHILDPVPKDGGDIIGTRDVPQSRPGFTLFCVGGTS